MTLTLNLLDQFIYEQQRLNEQLSFNNEKLETLLERIFSIEELIYPKKFSGPLLQGSYDSDFWRIDISDLPSFSNTRKEGWIPIIPPAIVDGSVPRIGSELSALVILKQSQNKELAMEYLSFVSCNKDQYQTGLSLMLLSQECLLNAESFYSHDVIKIWDGFLPFISFNTDALGGDTYAREFEGVTMLVRNLFMPWTDETSKEHAPFEIKDFLMNLDSDARFYHEKKH